MSTETTNGKTASPSSNNNNNTPTSSSSESSPGGASLAFNERNFSAKLDAVAPTQDSIQSLGLWILHHKFHHEAICRIWLDKLTDCQYNSYSNIYRVEIYIFMAFNSPNYIIQLYINVELCFCYFQRRRRVNKSSHCSIWPTKSFRIVVERTRAYFKSPLRKFFRELLKLLGQ